MPTNDWILALTSISALIAGLAAIITNLRKPALDSATAQKAFVDSDAVKQEIKRMSDESNIRRDLRILDLEKWGEDMRPWIFAMKERDEMMCTLIREDREALGLDMPHIPPLPGTPPFPRPRPLAPNMPAV